MAFNEQMYDDAQANPLGFTADDDGLPATMRALPNASAMVREPVRETRRTADEKAADAQEFARAAFAARQRWAPAATREGRWLELLAWVAACLRELRRAGRTFTTEREQYAALYEMKKLQVGRIPATDVVGDVHIASRHLWALTHARVEAAA